MPAKSAPDHEFQRALDRHFALCTAIAGAAALCSAPAGARAAIVYSGEKNLAAPTDGSPLRIDLDTGAFSTTDDIAGFDLEFTSLQRASDSTLSFKGGANGADVAVGTHTVTHSSSSSSSSSTVTYNTVGKLKAGALISGGATLVDYGTLGRYTPASSSSSSSSSGPTHSVAHSTGPWGKGGTGYVGFQFLSAANTTLYGWARLAVGTDLSVTVVDWAYEDDGTPINAGAVQQTSVAIKVLRGTATPGSPALIKIKRTGDLTGKLKVAYKISGGTTAVDGTDFVHLNGKAVIPAGKKSVTFSVDALPHEPTGGSRTLALKFLKDQGYAIATKPTAVRLVVENQP